MTDKDLQKSLKNMYKTLDDLSVSLLQFTSKVEEEKRNIIHATFQNNQEIEIEYHEKCILKMREWLKVELLSETFLNKLIYWNTAKHYSYAVIYETMQLINSKVLNKLESKKFECSDHACNYITKIIDNQLEDGLKLFLSK